jgi:hypothetical protein
MFSKILIKECRAYSNKESKCKVNYEWVSQQGQVLLNKVQNKIMGGLIKSCYQKSIYLRMEWKQLIKYR